MSLSKQPQNKSSVFSAATVYNVPVLAERYDRFCSSCGKVIELLALEKYPGQQCLTCTEEVEFLDKSDGLYRRCVRCMAFVRCTMKFCYMCGRENQFFDKDKPHRLERQKRAQMKEEILKKNELDVSVLKIEQVGGKKQHGEAGDEVQNGNGNEPCEREMLEFLDSHSTHKDSLQSVSEISVSE